MSALYYILPTALLIVGAILYVVWAWRSVSVKNALLEAEKKQRDSDQKRNAKINEEYLDDIKKIDKQVGDSVNPSDPWSGV